MASDNCYKMGRGVHGVEEYRRGTHKSYLANPHDRADSKCVLDRSSSVQKSQSRTHEGTWQVTGIGWNTEHGGRVMRGEIAGGLRSGGHPSHVAGFSSPAAVSS